MLIHSLATYILLLSATASLGAVSVEELRRNEQRKLVHLKCGDSQLEGSVVATASIKQENLERAHQSLRSQFLCGRADMEFQSARFWLLAFVVGIGAVMFSGCFLTAADVSCTKEKRPLLQKTQEGDIENAGLVAEDLVEHEQLQGQHQADKCAVGVVTIAAAASSSSSSLSPCAVDDVNEERGIAETEKRHSDASTAVGVNAIWDGDVENSVGLPSEDMSDHESVGLDSTRSEVDLDSTRSEVDLDIRSCNGLNASSLQEVTFQSHYWSNDAIVATSDVDPCSSDDGCSSGDEAETRIAHPVVPQSCHMNGEEAGICKVFSMAGDGDDPLVDVVQEEEVEEVHEEVVEIRLRELESVRIATVAEVTCEAEAHRQRLTDEYLEWMREAQVELGLE